MDAVPLNNRQIRQLLTMPQVAEILGVREQKVYIMARQGMFPVVRLGRQLRTDPDKLQEWIDRGGQTITEENRVRAL